MALNARQQVFVDEYLQTWNASEAARRAGYSERTAASQGQRLLMNVDIAAAMADRLADLKLSTDEGLVRLAAQARGSLSTFLAISERWTDAPRAMDEIVDERVDEDAKGKPIRRYRVRCVVVDVAKLLDPNLASLVRKLKDSPREGLVVELYDAQEATVKLLEAAGAFKSAPLGLIDYGRLSTEQLERIAAGEDPLAVLISGDGAGAS
jgi:hypothetical protein